MGGAGSTARPINTAGAEDRPFITADGQTLFFTFTPDPDLPAEEQLFDGVAGTYLSRRQVDGWSEPERVVLTDPGELALDGCPFLLGETLCFCSARQGNLRGVDLWAAQYREGRWTRWANAGPRLNGDLQAGEMHISADGTTMYFHADRPGGAGGLDLWITRLVDGEWSEPENLGVVNSPADDSRPALSPDGTELWFTRIVDGAPAVMRSKWDGEAWSSPADPLALCRRAVARLGRQPLLRPPLYRRRADRRRRYLHGEEGVIRRSLCTPRVATAERPGRKHPVAEPREARGTPGPFKEFALTPPLSLRERGSVCHP